MNNREWLYSLDVADLSDWFDAEHVEEQAHESRENYEERMYDVPVSDCPYCGCSRVVIHEYCDAYDRSHSYRVEHVDEREAFNRGCFESYYAFDSVEKAVEHADMRDEPTNGIDGETNGTHADAPLVDDNVVEILRRPLHSITDIGRAIGALGEDEHVGGSGDASYILDRLADMVERDYVRRDDYDFTVEMLNCMKSERDDLQKELDIANAKLAGKPECEICDRATLLEEIEGLTAERDELEMRVNSLVAELGDAEGTSIILERQRDEWKAKAEQAERAMNKAAGNWARADARSAKRAAAVERLRNIPCACTKCLMNGIIRLFR